VLIAFLLTVGLWITPGIIALAHGVENPVFRWFNARLPEAMASLFGAILLFVLPTDCGAGSLHYLGAIQRILTGGRFCFLVAGWRWAK
jgi:hypothetical protein